jgi:sugar/nucleoside kinase (ribokinase family)
VSGYALLHEPSREAIAGWLERLPPECVVLVDPGPLWRGIPAPVLAVVRRRASWWSCNLDEAAASIGLASTGLVSAGLVSAEPVSAGLEAARRLAAESRAEGGAGMGVVVRLGADGCVILAPGAEPVHVPGFAVEVLDSNGAGDAHVGAFLAALAAGQHPIAAVRRANACAALAVTRSGPATAPTAAEVDALLASGA